MALFPPGLSLQIRGVVQGVGFRPFIYRLALRYGITGNIRNTGDGVYIEAYGDRKRLAAFVQAIKQEAPPLAVIEDIFIQPLNGPPPRLFTVLDSQASHKATRIPPDVATCPTCLKELFDPRDRRYRYPFINCTDCGPRFSVIEDLPYDRGNTTMRVFPMCSACLQEYSDPAQRRFHAETNACPQCGPQIWLVDSSGKRLSGADPLKQALRALKEGKILALRGLGGFHLAVDASNEGAIRQLRARKKRPRKPLAIMVPNLETTSRLVHLSTAEKEALISFRRPIVLARQKSSVLAPSLAPGLKQLGLMLPYTPLHHLLLREGGFTALVMTSGNPSGEPLCYRNEEALKRLKGVADFFLLHDREIVLGIDDSVVKEVGGKIRLIRRARGFVPEPLPFPAGSPNVLAVGPLLKNTFCLTREKEAFVSQHLGDLDNLETEGFFRKTLKHFQRLLGVTPDLIACDLHPGYLSSSLAEELANKYACPLIKVPHHVAHAAAVMGEFALKKALALALDGLGLGPDGSLWGGEILLVEQGRFERLAYLRPVPQPGGDAASKEPWRMALAYLYVSLGEQALDRAQELFSPPLSPNVVKTVWQMLKKGLNSPLSSACGRLFDACAALLGLCLQNSFEGEAPMLLESLAQESSRLYPLPLQGKILDTRPLITSLIKDLDNDVPKEEMAYAVHRSLAQGFAEALFSLSKRTGVRQVVLSGGCFQNALLTQLIMDYLNDRGLTAYLPEKLPVNDGGLAYGQALWAAWTYKRQ